MYFTNRTEAGKILAHMLSEYYGENIVVYGIPRGGIVVAFEVAIFLQAPLDIVLTRKIGHPYNPEYALAAVSENGYFVGSEQALEDVDTQWLHDEIVQQKAEIKRRRTLYGRGRKRISPEKKIAILIDDGIATGLSIRVAISELQHYKPQSIVVAVPIASASAKAFLDKEVDTCIAIEVPSDEEYLGGVGAYYDNFQQVSDEKIIDILKQSDQQFAKEVL